MPRKIADKENNGKISKIKKGTEFVDDKSADKKQKLKDLPKKNKASKTKDVLKEKAEKIKKEIVPKAKEVAKEKTEKVKKEIVPKAKEVAKEKTEKVKKEIVPKAKKVAKEKTEKVKKEIVPKAKEVAREKTKKVKKEIVPKAKKVAKEKTEKLKKEVVPTIKEKNNKIGKEISSKVTKSKLTILDKIKDFFSRDPEKISELDEKIEEKNYLSEYYDLPYRYNETVVKILAQTPKRLFIYWDISDKDNETYRKAFGEDFFEKTYPVLLIHNEEKNYTYEVPINDFANSWYLDIKDSKNKYSVQLGRKFKKQQDFEIDEQLIKRENIKISNDYIEIVSSNILETPNDHILFENFNSNVVYRNVKTKEESTKSIKPLINGVAKTYDLYDLYNIIYKEEFENERFNLNNPSSAGVSSSSMGRF